LSDDTSLIQCSLHEHSVPFQNQILLHLELKKRKSKFLKDTFILINGTVQSTGAPYYMQEIGAQKIVLHIMNSQI